MDILRESVAVTFVGASVLLKCKLEAVVRALTCEPNLGISSIIQSYVRVANEGQINEKFLSQYRRTLSTVHKLKGRKRYSFLSRDTTFQVDLSELVGEAFFASSEELGSGSQGSSTPHHDRFEQISTIHLDNESESTTQVGGSSPPVQTCLALSGLERKNVELRSTVSSLESEVAQLEEALRKQDQNTVNFGNYTHSGALIGQGSRRNDYRLLSKLSSQLYDQSEALVLQYGVHLSSVLVQDNHEQLHELNYEDDSVTKNVRRSLPHSSFFEMTNAEKKRIEDLVYVLDEHTVSNTAWNELKRVLPSLPTLKTISECRDYLDEEFQLSRTPGTAPGAQVSFKRELCRYIKSAAEKSHANLEEFCRSNPSVIVKIEGDGCNVTRKGTWTTLSFSTPDGDDRHSPKNHCLLGIIQTKENYFALREGFGEIIKEVNDVSAQRGILVDDKFVSVDLCFGADLKFILLLQGMQSAASSHPCPICKASKEERSNPSIPSGFFNSSAMTRTLDGMKKDCDNMTNSVRYPPLLMIEPSRVVPDIMHMGMRIVDRLVENLILEMQDKDSSIKVCNTSAKEDHVAKLIAIIHDCGVSIHLFSSNDSKHQGRSFSSLTGTDVDVLLEKLPGRLRDVLHHDTAEDVVLLWNILREVLNVYKNDTSGSDVSARTKLFLDVFVRLGANRKGYGRDRVTPYIHIFCAHSAQKHVQLHCLGHYSSQGLEKKNYTLKKLHHTKTNKWDAAWDVLKIVKRGELQTQRPPVRNYTKRSREYWSLGGIQESRKKRPRRSVVPRNDNPSGTLNLDAMRPGEIRTELAHRGINTSTRDFQKLKQMLRDSER